MNRVIQAPYRRRRFLVFDTETTDRPKKGAPIESQPYITQLSFVIYDIAERRIVRSYDSYVNIPQDVVITEFITDLTGATREKCDGGKKIVEVLRAFYDAYVWCDGLVAHNIDFDIEMIEIEILRNRDAILAYAPYCLSIFNSTYEKINRVDRFCTMKRGTKLCGIKTTNVTPENTNNNSSNIDSNSTMHPALRGVLENTVVVETKPARNKWPRLVELYESLFQEKPSGLHNSMVDVLVCLRCYVKMRHGYDVGNQGSPTTPPF